MDGSLHPQVVIVAHLEANAVSLRINCFISNWTIVSITPILSTVQFVNLELLVDSHPVHDFLKQPGLLVVGLFQLNFGRTEKKSPIII